jgi:hypothetical protein
MPLTDYSNPLALLAMLLAIVLIIVGFVLISVGKWGGLLVIGCRIIIAFLWRRLTINQRIAVAEENLYNAKINLENAESGGLNEFLAGSMRKKIAERERLVTNLRARW